MKTLENIIDTIKHPTNILFLLDVKSIKRLSDEKYLKIKYRRTFGKKIDFKNPKTFNEKLNWLKLNDRKKEYINLVDKYEVKKYISQIIGEEYIIPTIGIYDKFEDINFDELPNQFVIKCTHDSGSTIICKDKKQFDYNYCKKMINKCLKKNIYFISREWPYKNVKPRIIIEELLIDNVNNDLRDYKFFCFDGNVNFFKIDFDRFTCHRANYYNNKMELLAFGEEVCPPDFNKKLSMPVNFIKMKELAEKLSENIPFLRVDFYEVNNKIYFGELTFYPAAGFGKFIPNDWDLKLGEMIDLEKVK